MKVKLNDLDELLSKVIANYGYNEKETEMIKAVLMYAQLRGNNQGLVKLIGKGIPKNEQEKPSSVLKETKLSQLIDGGKRFGMLVMNEATEIAIGKAKDNGFGIVGIKNTSSSTGAIGYYARKIAEQDLIGLVFAGSPPTVNPHGSFEAKFGTNPLAVGIPGLDRMFVFDMATSAMAWFGLVQAKTAGQKISGDIAYDSEGNLTTDPAKAMDGAIRPFDRSYKGYGLSLLVEILTGPLVAASFVGINEEDGWGNLVIVINPELLVEIEDFKKNMAVLLDNVKTARKLEGVDEIYIPGEKGDELAKETESQGEIEIETNLYAQLQDLLK